MYFGLVAIFVNSFNYLGIFQHFRRGGVYNSVGLKRMTELKRRLDRQRRKMMPTQKLLNTTIDNFGRSNFRLPSGYRCREFGIDLEPGDRVIVRDARGRDFWAQVVEIDGRIQTVTGGSNYVTAQIRVLGRRR